MKRPKRKNKVIGAEPASSPVSEKAAITAVTTNNLREEGNAFYKGGKLDEACIKYIEAAKLSPTESAPVRNLSAALYELGKYGECIFHAQAALKLVEEERTSDMEIQVKKLNARIEKAQSCIADFGDEEKQKRRNWLMGPEGVARCRPSMFQTSEYLAVGHDVAASLFDPDSLDLESESVAFFFGGVGDGRTVLQTFIDIANLEQIGKVKERTYHFSVNDISKSAIARNLVLWMMLDELSDLEEGGEDAVMLMNTMYFVYIGTMMPGYAFEQLCGFTEKALNMLKNREQPLKWLYLHEEDMEKYVEVLGAWIGSPKDLFTSAEIVQRVRTAMIGKNEDAEFLEPNEELYEQERKLYLESAVLLPAQEVLEQHDSTMLELISRNSNIPKVPMAVFKGYVEENWHFNTTLVDTTWYKGLQPHFDVGFDPFESVRHFPVDKMISKPKNSTRLFDHFAPFFMQVAKAVKFLGGRLQIEAFLGDYVDVAERLQFGLYTNDEAEEDWPYRPASFPVLYDRVHLGNVPDYTSGHLTTFLHALPLLTKKPSSYIKANCFHNSSFFKTLLSYTSEYNLLTSGAHLSSLAGIRVLVRENDAITLPMTDYTYYAWSQAQLVRSWSKKSKFSDLVPRAEFTTWFYALFLRVVLPFKQSLESRARIIFSPLNISVLLRLASHMVGLGYPAHWFSEIFHSIISGSITTTARPPCASPLKASDVHRPHATRKLCTSPFRHELATLMRLFEPILPFQVADELTPRKEEIYQYNFHLPGYDNSNPQPSCLALLFMSHNYTSSIPNNAAMDRLKLHPRSLLDPAAYESEASLKSSQFEALRGNGLVLWSSFTFDVENKVASAWMGEGFIDMVGGMDGDQWTVGLFRTDIWEPAFKVPELVTESVQKGERWNGDSEMNTPSASGGSPESMEDSFE
ncbi:hypothetical protein BGZ60DRAFT_516386 [Tricladium varicosporioides]|nr:hypothetical protein BGZ60DRAFT_516386 [Hymenoscyphus varicosporioides]